MSAKPAAAPSGKKKLVVILLVVALCSVGAGVAVPRFMAAPARPEEKPQARAPEKDVQVEFGGVVVNLNEPRLGRYLRVKVVLVTDAKHEKDVSERLEARKATLRNWLITHLSDKTLQDVTGRVSINRIRREIQEQFSTALFPEGGQQIRDVLFDEFQVQ